MTKNNTTPKIEIGTTSGGSLILADIVDGIRHLVPAKLLKEFDAAEPESHDAYMIYEDIEYAMDEIAPDGCYFGAHPGDGSDIGFWQCEDWDAED